MHVSVNRFEWFANVREPLALLSLINVRLTRLKRDERKWKKIRKKEKKMFRDTVLTGNDNDWVQSILIGQVIDLPESGSFNADAHVAMQRTVIARTGSILLRGRRGYVNWLVCASRPYGFAANWAAHAQTHRPTTMKVTRKYLFTIGDQACRHECLFRDTTRNEQRALYFSRSLSQVTFHANYINLNCFKIFLSISSALSEVLKAG